LEGGVRSAGSSDEVNTSLGTDVDPSAAVLPVFHGTRQSLADRILEQGFRPLSVVAQIAAVAERYNLPVETLTAHLAANHRFTLLDDRLGTVSMTADPDRAGDWAVRAPEATWDALRSAYDLLNPELGDGSNQTGKGRFWVLAQQLTDPPVIVVAAAPVTALRSWGFSAGKTAVELLQTLGSDGFLKFFLNKSEWRAAADHVTALKVHETPTRLDRYDITFMADVDSATFNEQVVQGVWGDPGLDDPDEMPWWSFTEVWSRLTSARRAELEAIAGHPLQ
jgi:hypothetical protein